MHVLGREFPFEDQHASRNTRERTAQTTATLRPWPEEPTPTSSMISIPMGFSG